MKNAFYFILNALFGSLDIYMFRYIFKYFHLRVSDFKLTQWHGVLVSWVLIKKTKWKIVAAGHFYFFI